jgi:hypothetical protein
MAELKLKEKMLVEEEAKCSTLLLTFPTINGYLWLSPAPAFSGLRGVLTPGSVLLEHHTADFSLQSLTQPTAEHVQRRTASR